MLPEAQEAATERSPNRKPRIRAVLKKYRHELAQKVWLEHYGATGNFFEACLAVGRKVEQVKAWLREDKKFCGAWLEIRDRHRAYREGRLADLAEKAIQVYDETISEGKDRKLALEAARDILRSEGLLKREGVAVAVGVQVNTGPPKYILIEVVGRDGDRDNS